MLTAPNDLFHTIIACLWLPWFSSENALHCNPHCLIVTVYSPLDGDLLCVFVSVITFKKFTLPVIIRKLLFHSNNQQAQDFHRVTASFLRQCFSNQDVKINS